MKNRNPLFFIVLAFGISWLAWGICIIFDKFGISMTDNYLLYVPDLLGGVAPSIASYVVLKKEGRVKNFKEWCVLMFDVKVNFKYYVLTVFFVLFFLGISYLVIDVEVIAPWYLFFLALPIMVIGGGLEEPGWRGYLQPYLAEKHGFVAGTFIMGLIWSLWHLPLFYYSGTTQYGTSFLLFAIAVFGLNYAIGALRKISNSTFLCLVLHCSFNALYVVFNFDKSRLINDHVTMLVGSCLLIAVSIILIFVDKRKKI